MSSLYKRANSRQRKILRIVEGAVKNVAHAHPDLNVTDRTARSIAKRAAGTLTAQWPDVLAISWSSDSHAVAPAILPYGPGKAKDDDGASGRGASQRSRRSPFPRLYRELSWRTGQAHLEGKLERRATLIEILRLIDKIEKGIKQEG